MSLPYFPMYPTDFEAKTSHLTLAEDGAYNRLLRICWMTPGCSIPNDAAWIMRRLRVDQEAFDTVVKVVISEFFNTTNGRLSNAKLTRIFEQTNEAHKKRVQAGAKGGKAKSLAANKKTPSNALAMTKQPEPEPEPDKEREAKASLSSDDDLPRVPKPVDDVSQAVTEYNAAAAGSGWPQVRILSKARRSALAARLKECDGIEGWRAALGKAQRSSHCCGQNDRGWTISFDFLTRQSGFAKLMEGNYDNRDSNPNAPNGSRHSSTADAFLAVAARYASGGTGGGGCDDF